MRRRLAELGVPCPRHAVVDRVRPRSCSFAAAGRRASRSCSRPPAADTTARGSGSSRTSSRPTRSSRRSAPGRPLLVEERVDFRRELSAVVARAPSGQQAAYPVVESVQRDGICVEVVAPAPGLDPELAVDGPADRDADRGRARRDRDPGRRDVRDPVDGGCWSTSSRCVRTTPGTGRSRARSPASSRTTCARCSTCPLGAPHARAPWTVMVNILGGSAPTLFDGYPHVQARDPRSRCICTARRCKPGRKVGHVTAYGTDLDEVRERARHAAGWFEGSLGPTDGTATHPRVSAMSTASRDTGRRGDGVRLRLADDERRRRGARRVRRRVRGRRRLRAPDACRRCSSTARGPHAGARGPDRRAPAEPPICRACWPRSRRSR